MTERVDVFVCGLQAGDPPQPRSSDVIMHAIRDRPLNRFSTAELNDLLHGAEADAVAFVDSRLAGVVSALDQAAERLSEVTGAVLIFGSAETQRPWEDYPQPLAALVRPLAENAAVLVRKSTLDARGRLADVSDPLWEWVIRCTRDGRRIESVVSPVDRETTEGHMLPRLVPRLPDRSRNWLREILLNAQPAEWLGPVTSPADAAALQAGLLQVHDFLDDSHARSQSIEGEGRHAAGDYWHAIHHRREPDYGNSKYWFRRVGRHPAFAELGPLADEVVSRLGGANAESLRRKLGLPDAWDALAFVDFCQECERSSDSWRVRIAEEIQWCEMLLLLDHTYRDARG